MRKFIITTLLFFGLLTLSACGSSVTVNEPDFFKPDPSASFAGVFTLTDQVAHLRLSPVAASRLYAYTLLAGDLAYRSAPADQAEAASASAIEYVASKLFENEEASTNMKHYRLRFSPEPNTFGIKAGETAVRIANLDGFNELDTKNTANESASTPELWMWEPTGLIKSPGFEPNWGGLYTLVPDYSSCSLPPPDLNLLETQANDLLTKADVLENSKEVELFLAGDGTPTPSGQWLRAVARSAEQAGIPGSEYSSLLAKAGVVAYDASVLTWKEKFHYNIARPETMWKRLAGAEVILTRETPPHPSYPSGHSVFSSGIANIMWFYLGDRPISFSLNEDMIAPAETFAFDTQWEAVAAASNSRVDAFFHYPLDTEAGELLGACVAKIVNDNYFTIFSSPDSINR